MSVRPKKAASAHAHNPPTTPNRTQERLLGGDSYLGIVESVVGSSNADGEGKAGARALQVCVYVCM